MVQSPQLMERTGAGTASAQIMPSEGWLTETGVAVTDVLVDDVLLDDELVEDERGLGKRKTVMRTSIWRGYDKNGGQPQKKSEIRSRQPPFVGRTWKKTSWGEPNQGTV
jgi:hypothetical protein